jgi:predicted nucleotidyltransferase
MKVFLAGKTEKVQNMDIYTEYINGWMQRIRNDEKRAEVERKRAFTKAKKAAVFLAKKYDVDKVVLFGSVISGTFNKASDIDIAVSGLPAEIYIRAIVELEELINANVDLKPIEECKGLIKDRIDQGLVIYEKKS